jgi:hypothetical protein
MIYRGPGFLVGRMIRLYAQPSLPPPSPDRKLFLFLSLPVCRTSSLLTGVWGGGGGGGEKKRIQ